MERNQSYLKQKLTYTDNGKLLDEFGRAVMMDWETNWMKESAKVICQNGGNILNIGFGMGIIDTFIETYDIKSHTIIEAHPDVYNKMIQDGWDKKPNVKIIYSTWQNVINDLPKYDGIYYDTFYDNGFYDLLLPNIKNILNKGGVFSYWEGSSDQSINRKTIKILHKDFEFDKIIIKLNNVPDTEEQNEKSKKFYFNPNWNQCVIPIIKHKTTSLIKTLI
jgi:spermidine synthase